MRKSYIFIHNIGDAPGSIPQPKIVFPPCTSDCDSKCVDHCPDYCCVKGLESKENRLTQQVKEDRPVTDPPTRGFNPHQAPLYCPDTCSRICSISCPDECCDKDPKDWTETTSRYTNTKPCPAHSCNSRGCSSSCPSHCCQADKASEAGQLEIFEPSSSQTASHRSGLSCPALCSKSCFEGCPEHCCHKTNQKQTKKVQHGKNFFYGNSVLRKKKSD